MEDHIVGRLNNLIRQIERAACAIMEAYTAGDADDVASVMATAKANQKRAHQRMHDFVRELIPPEAKK